MDRELTKKLFFIIEKNVHEIKIPEDRSLILQRIGESIAKINDLKSSKRLIQDSLEATREIKDYYSRCISISNIGHSMIRLGDYEFGKKLFLESVEVARKIDNLIHSSIEISNNGKSLANLGEINLAKDLFQEAIESSQKIKKYDERGKTVLKIFAESIPIYGYPSAYNFFETFHESHPDIPQVVVSYAEAYRKIDWEKPESGDLFVYYIRSFLWAPYHAEIAKKSAYDAIATLAKLGKVEEALEAAKGIGLFSE
jgi:tetratricopeptide (TPR) repeat protein